MKCVVARNCVRFGSRATALRFALLVLFGAFLWAPLAGADLQPGDLSPAGVSASRPVIGTDGKGDVVAIWRELDGDSSVIRAASRPKGGEWSSERISAPAPDTESPALAMDRDGNAVAAWHRSDGADSVVQAAVRPAGGAWSAAEDLSSPADPAFDVEVAAEHGRIAAVWVVLRNRHTLVVSSTRSVDGAWSPPRTLAGPVGNPGAPTIALDDDGGAVAAWRWSNGAYRVVEAASMASDGTWATPVVLSGPSRNATPPRLAMDAEGHAIVGWLRSNGDWTVAQVSSRSADGSWARPVTLSKRAGDARNLDLDMTRDGHAIVSWRQGDPNSNLWSASRSPENGAWGDPSPIAYNWLGAKADVALDEQGNATAVWSSYATVSASYKPVGKPWQDDYLLSSYDDSATAPAVAAYGTEVATAVWIRAGENDDRIQFVDYDVNTSAQEAEDEGDDGGDDGDGEDSGERFMGTAKADRLVGTPGNDVFYGLGGNDVIVGRGGRDVIYGGPGNDRILGGPGPDRLHGGLGNDTIVGGRGADRISGDWGRDRIFGGGGADVLRGGAGRDLIRGGLGNDVLLARDQRRDVVTGGRGLDQYRLDRWLDRARSIESRFR
jgi:hemolysin type calcium-binding protein